MKILEMSDEMKTRIGERLTEELKMRGISAKELAEGIGVSPSAISYIRAGKRTLSAELAQKIADFLSDREIKTARPLKVHYVKADDPEFENKPMETNPEDCNITLEKIELPKFVKTDKIKTEYSVDGQDEEVLRFVSPEYLLGQTADRVPAQELNPIEKPERKLEKDLLILLQDCGYEIEAAYSMPELQKEVDWDSEKWQGAENLFGSTIKKSGTEQAYRLTPSETYILLQRIIKQINNTMEDLFEAKDIAAHFNKKKLR